MLDNFVYVIILHEIDLAKKKILHEIDLFQYFTR